MRVTVEYDDETGLLEIVTSSGRLPINQTETAALYIILRKILGWRGRMTLFMKRRMFAKV